MPFKDPQRKKEYHTDYMRRWRRDSRASVKPADETPLFDPTRPYRRDSLAVVVQDRAIFCRSGDSFLFVGYERKT